MRTVSVDMKNCAKLVEEGVPTYVPETPNDHVVVHTSGESSAAESDDGAAMALASSSRGAWQWVGWRDWIGAAVNTDTTQINWSYNGSNTWDGFVDGYVTWKSSTGWQMKYAYEAGYQEPSGDYWRGKTWSKFSNTQFCDPKPDVYTYYYYNKVWGHPNGTATVSQSSDTIDECLVLHVEVYTGYGTYQP